MTSSNSIQIVIPMAGLGARFTEAGYSVAKPLLPIHDQPMFLVVAANLFAESVGRIVVVAQRSFNLGDTVSQMRARLSCPVELIEVDYLTGGPADTVELARPFLRIDQPVVTANSDQYVDHSILPLYDQLQDPAFAGSILTMKDDDPKWSYVACNANGDVTLVREKRVISSDATVGIYGFRTASLMWEAFEAMRAANDTVKGEYYVAPSYNQLIKRGHRVGIYDLGPISETMHGMGIPEDYEAFLQSPASLRASKRSRRLFGDL